MHTKAMIFVAPFGMRTKAVGPDAFGNKTGGLPTRYIPPAMYLGSHRMSIPCGHVVATIDGHVTSGSKFLQDFSIHRAS
jgi:hypothetical protein